MESNLNNKDYVQEQKMNEKVKDFQEYNLI